jgi:hypothetical protein
MENTGDSDYNALDFSLEKRYSNRWSGRISYSLSKSVGTANDQADKNLHQAMTNLNLDLWRGPSNVDRRHILSLGAQTEIPKTGGATLSATARYMSGAPFTIYDSSIDADRNGELVDPVPAGTYSGPSSNRDAMQNVTYAGGRNGAVGPDYFQLDLAPAGGAESGATRHWKSSSTSSTSPTVRTSTTRRRPIPTAASPRRFSY